ncbi:ribonuclease H-like domain-containing protein [Tanacetum coccineum]
MASFITLERPWENQVLQFANYNVSLLFVHKIASDSKFFVGFDETKCYIQDLKANRTVRICNKCNGLYLFDVDNACKIVANSCIASCYVSKSLWHQRLGHRADKVLDILKPALNIDSHSVSNHLCDTCNKAKQTRKPFPLSEHKFTKIGQLDHLYVWCPYKIVRRDGFRYFLTVVDDFSRVVWVYMLKGKDDVYDSIISFVQIEKPKRPNDEGGFSSYDDGTELSPEFQDDDNPEETSIEENNKHPKGNVSDDADLVGDFYENLEFNSENADLPVNNVIDLEEDVYMTIPQGFSDKDDKNMVYKLVKSLYGVKQAPRKWNEKLVSVLKENDFVQFANDYSLFTKDNKVISLLVYVDDIVVTGNCVSEIDQFKIFLKSKFSIKDLGSLKYSLGIEVLNTGNDICLSQRKYCLESLKDYGLLGCKLVSTPM